MPEPSSPSEPQAGRCNACLEPIRAGARVCPHCRSPQSHPGWRSFGVWLKWVAAAVTIISLISGVRSLHGLYEGWRATGRAVAEMVAAGSRLAAAGDYTRAWDRYRDALQLSPGSSLVLEAKVELAQVWIRNGLWSPGVEGRMAVIAASR